MEEGKRVVESNGRTGYTARLWKVVYIDGKRDEENAGEFQFLYVHSIRCPCRNKEKGSAKANDAEER